MAPTLAQLLGSTKAASSVEITGLTVDSRAVHKGNMFVALPGNKLDGRAYIEAAIKAGASAVLTTPGVYIPDPSIALIEANNPRRRYADMSARFYGQQPEVQVAVTGTNGKTSVADFCRQIWRLCDLKAASLGTLGVVSDVYSEPGGLTTPDPMALHGALYALAQNGVTHAALEASSHGLDQYRLDGVRLKAAGFTNLSRDHLDYHKTEQSYFYAKARLFGELMAPGDQAVINIDGQWGAVLDDIAWGRGLNSLTVGRSNTASMQLVEQKSLPEGQVVKVSFGSTMYEIPLQLIGDFQAENVMMAAGLVIAAGHDHEQVLGVLSQLVGVAGRMELVGSSENGGAVYVDYAHTPGGLETVLKAARAHKPNRLSVVFGCGGDRDTGKRPEMGKIAHDLADRVYVTDDNPRSENPAEIRRAILPEAPDATEIGDRKAAIEAAITDLQSGDILIVAGKGHEEGQIIGDTVVPFSDIETVRSLLAGRHGHADR